MNEHIKHLLSLPDTPRYNIKAVVQQTSVNISTLRAWEQRYGIPNPKRSEHGHRLYSQRDVAIMDARRNPAGDRHRKSAGEDL